MSITHIKLNAKYKLRSLLCDPDYNLHTFFLAPMKKIYFQKTDRILGCQSKNHTQCSGELWICERCKKRVCCEEGSTDLVEICDDCWVDVRINGIQWESQSDKLEREWNEDYRQGMKYETI